MEELMRIALALLFTLALFVSVEQLIKILGDFATLVLIVPIWIFKMIGGVEIFHGNINLILLLFSLKIFVIYAVSAFQLIDSASNDGKDGFALWRIGVIILSNIVSFAVIYFILYDVNGSTSFIGSIGDTFIERLISFLFFSLVTFSTVGYGDIHPVGNYARVVVALQIISAFIMVVYAISSYSVFRQIFAKDGDPSVNNHQSGEVEDTDDLDSAKSSIGRN
ncbi:MAG: hypothetical protein GX962_03515 [Epulopiscium sp.]|nr:hypothetical protein [Candidatus Epulonipiscium sp.]